MSKSSMRWMRRLAVMSATGGIMLQIIPFGCGQPILRLVTPVLLDDTSNVLDFIIRAVAPLVLP